MTAKKKNKKAFLYDESGVESDYELSLSKYVGKKVVDIVGYPTIAFDDAPPIFKLRQIMFEDGTTVFLEGEHDTVYLPTTNKLKNMDEETLQSFIEIEE